MKLTTWAGAGRDSKQQGWAHGTETLAQVSDFRRTSVQTLSGEPSTSMSSPTTEGLSHSKDATTGLSHVQGDMVQSLVPASVVRQTGAASNSMYIRNRAQHLKWQGMQL